MRNTRRSQRWPRAAAAAGISILMLAGLVPTAAAQDEEPLEIAYLSFAVANSYDAPMLAAAQEAAAAGNANITVFDANNDPAAQSTQLQNALTSGQYDGIITQPISGAGLVVDVEAAIAEDMAVANMDQVLGADMTTSDAQVEGLAANVVFVPSEIGRKMGELTVQACAQLGADPCEVGYVYSIKGIPLDIALKEAFDAATAGSPVTVTDEGEGFWNAASGLTAGQNMLTANPGIDVIVGSDQAITGVIQAAEAAEMADDILTVGYGGGAIALDDIAAGKRFATVMQLPATEGRLATEHLIQAIRTGTPVPGADPVSELPDGGVVTIDNVDQFTAEWPG